MTFFPRIISRFTVDNKENDSILSIHVACSIVERRLEILDPHDSEKHINKLSFNRVYYGSMVTGKVILFNNSPVASDFIVTIDEKMSECVDKSKNLAIALTKFDSINENQAIAPCLDSVFKASPQKVSNARRYM